MGRRLGFLVGINSYQDPTFLPLQYAETDARAFAKWLVDARGGNWNPVDVHLTLGIEATKERLEAQLLQICVQEASPGDLVFIYFAGHVFIDENSGEGFLAGSNTLYHQPASAIHLGSLAHQAMASSRAAQVVLMLDCFQTGSAWNKLRTSPFDFKPLIGQETQQSLLLNRGRILYCACRGNDHAPEVGEKGLGGVLYNTIVGLSGPAKDPSTGQVTLQKLYTYATAKSGTQQYPQIFGQESRPIVLVGAMPDLAPAAPTSQNDYAVPSFSAPKASGSQVAFQGVGESDPLVEVSSPRMGRASTDELSPITGTSGPLSLSILEQNRQRQCAKLIEQAHQSLQAQNIPEALNLIEQVLSIDPKNVDALTFKSQMLGSTGRFQEALMTVEQLLYVDPRNALAWSMQAALLANTGSSMEALEAINRSLTLNPQNPEAQAIKESIRGGLSYAPVSMSQPSPAQDASQERVPVRDSAKSFLLSALIQIFALLLGSAGAALLVLLPHLPIIAGFFLESLGLALLCVLATRGAYRYGFGRLFFTFLLSLVAGGALLGIYKFGYNRLISKILVSPPLIVPVLFVAVWFAAAAALPLLLGLGGFISGIVVGVRGKK